MKNDYVIIANGPFLVREIIEEVIQHKIIVALDGAANKLRHLKIQPDIILGDFDSIEDAHTWGIHATFENMHDHTIPYLGFDGVVIVPRKDQNFPDLVKGIRYCDMQSAKSITLICALGGRLDLHEATLRALRNEHKDNRNITLVTEQSVVRFAKNQSLLFDGEMGDNCAVLAYPEGTLTASGLKYNVENHRLLLGDGDSICNSLDNQRGEVKISGEALLIMPPQYASQRAFMQKSELERLQLMIRDLS